MCSDLPLRISLLSNWQVLLREVEAAAAGTAAVPSGGKALVESEFCTFLGELPEMDVARGNAYQQQQQSLPPGGGEGAAYRTEEQQYTQRQQQRQQVQQKFETGESDAGSASATRKEGLAREPTLSNWQVQQQQQGISDTASSSSRQQQQQHRHHQQQQNENTAADDDEGGQQQQQQQPGQGNARGSHVLQEAKEVWLAGSSYFEHLVKEGWQVREAGALQCVHCSRQHVSIHLCEHVPV
jgi:hypothetical protein